MEVAESEARCLLPVLRESGSTKQERQQEWAHASKNHLNKYEDRIQPQHSVKFLYFSSSI